MIDIHCHILNNVDDGTKDMLETMQCIQEAEKAGFTDIILTPHYNKDFYKNSKSEMALKIKNLKEVAYYNSSLVGLHQGNEIYMNEELVEWLENGVVSTLAGSRYVLFEVPMCQKLLATKDVVGKMIERGYIPVLAHPERYKFVQDNVEELKELIDMGVLIQCNYGSILGQYGRESKKTMITLLKNNMVSFLASDTHSSPFVYENFDKIIKELEKYISSKKILELTTSNAKYILNDMKIC